MHTHKLQLTVIGKTTELQKLLLNMSIASNNKRLPGPNEPSKTFRSTSATWFLNVSISLSNARARLTDCEAFICTWRMPLRSSSRLCYTTGQCTQRGLVSIRHNERGILTLARFDLSVFNVSTWYGIAFSAKFLIGRSNMRILCLVVHRLELEVLSAMAYLFLFS